MAAARVQTSPRPLQLDALPARQPAALDEPIELTRVERLVEGEGHDGLALAGPSADRHVADVDSPLATNGPLIPGDRDVGGRRRLPAPPPPDVSVPGDQRAIRGEWQVNIGHMSVGRGTSEREAVMALTLDEPLDARQLDRLVERCGLACGKGVEL